MNSPLRTLLSVVAIVLSGSHTPHLDTTITKSTLEVAKVLREQSFQDESTGLTKYQENNRDKKDSVQTGTKEMMENNDTVRRMTTLLTADPSQSDSLDLDTPLLKKPIDTTHIQTIPLSELSQDTMKIIIPATLGAGNPGMIDRSVGRESHAFMPLTQGQFEKAVKDALIELFIQEKVTIFDYDIMANYFVDIIHLIFVIEDGKLQFVQPDDHTREQIISLMEDMRQHIKSRISIFKRPFLGKKRMSKELRGNTDMIVETLIKKGIISGSQKNTLIEDVNSIIDLYIH